MAPDRRGPLSGRAIVLVGFMGCGKSAVGRLLADLLGREFVDTDERVETRSGMTIDRIFAELGEGRFRELEWEVLESLGKATGQVVSAGGGLYLGHRQRERVRGLGTAVWLDVSLETARRRVGRGLDRPLWNEDDPIALRALFEKRRASYALADLRVDANRRGPGEVADAIRSRLSPVGR